MTLFRKHRGSLDESMETCVEVHSFDELYEIIHDELSPYMEVAREDVDVKYYCNDHRIGWTNTHIVIVKNFGIIGFTNGEIHPMTLDEAILHCEEKACDNSACSKEHQQLAEWLKELKKYREKN